MSENPSENMLCFVQGFGDQDNGLSKIRSSDAEKLQFNSNLKRNERVQRFCSVNENNIEAVGQRGAEFGRPILNTGRSFRQSSRDRFLKNFPDVKRTFSDRFSAFTEAGKKPPKGFLDIRKTWSTGNFPTGAGGGAGAARSAPATPLQIEPHARSSKHDKQAVKPFSGSAPSVQVAGLPDSGDATECKHPSKSRQKKFQRHFPQVGPEERVLNYYSCALVGDLLLQGHLYITKNYFAFYSNVFGYVTKLLIPTSSVVRITKEKVARIIPNAVGVCTKDERHVFGSLLSRDSTYKLMTLVWKAARVSELAVPKPQDIPVSEVEVSEYSPEDDSSSGGADHVDSVKPVRVEPEAIISTSNATVIQPALLTGSVAQRRHETPRWHWLIACLVLMLATSALYLTYQLSCLNDIHDVPSLSSLSGEDVVRWRARLHGRAAAELHAFLSTNLMLLAKVRQSLEALSGVILTDMADGDGGATVPNDTKLS
ncbi:uncharacterized protein LOC126980151 isoform X2 [Leptidea sinapis]|uniref:uncharacterized protein LOC126980151 isoform X2 n=1 Tax=Leptidea sinapis TaxID=189913 RepID=UPI0021C304CE|nr:uncharacterized protein LOC126980151 isoform X2 [Leptidea sinapis]